MTVNVEIVRGTNENNLSALRRFTKKVQTAGVLSRVRKNRYSERNISENVKRKRALKRIAKRAVITQALKAGKIIEKQRGRR
ncbi:MAG TPA: 30S ribosomal protein S21 [Candidatus Paceibacterota bacterium]